MDLSHNSSQTPQPQIIPTVVGIDQTWVSSCVMGLKQNLIICPVCYTIPIDNPVECAKCERLFCKQCFDKISQVQNAGDKKCPTCKMQPWKRKDGIHISYKHMLDSLRFKCKICQESETSKDQMMESEQMTHNVFKSHLFAKHNMFLSSQSILFDFVMIPSNGQKIKLSWIQNLEINLRITMNAEIFSIGAPKGEIYDINLKEMKVYNSKLGYCQLQRFQSQTLEKNKQYIIWGVKLNRNYDQSDESEDRGLFQQFLESDSLQSQQQNRSNHRQWKHTNKRQDVFYSEELQLILQKNYQEFLSNPKLNAFCLDINDYRYLIDFKTKEQTNLFTKQMKQIKRLPVILK